MKRVYDRVESFECPRLKGNKYVYIRHHYVESETPGKFVFWGSRCSGASREYTAEKRCNGEFAPGVRCMNLLGYPQEDVFPSAEHTYVEYGPYD